MVQERARSLKTARCTACRRQAESANLPPVGEHRLVCFIPSDPLELRAESAKTDPCVIALNLRQSVGLLDRIVGRYTLERVKHPITGELVVDVNEEITEAIALGIEEAGIEAVRVRTVLTCEAKHGVCRCFYGLTLPLTVP